MRHWGGDEWDRWNDVMREDLVRTQITDGPEAGSWTPRDKGVPSAAGGRLFSTCLGTLTLEVYYRYLPLFDEVTIAVAPAPSSDSTADQAGTESINGSNRDPDD